MDYPNFSEIINKNQEDNCKGLNVHDQYKSLSVEELTGICKEEEKNYKVMALNVNGDLNTGSMVRLSSVMGANEFIVFGRRKWDRRSSVGSQNYIKVSKVDGLIEDKTKISTELFCSYLKENSISPVFIELGGIPVNKFSWKSHYENCCNSGKTMCIIMGNESDGIPEEILKMNLGPTISIPQRGVLRSINVSNACAIALYSFCNDMNWL